MNKRHRRGRGQGRFLALALAFLAAPSEASPEDIIGYGPVSPSLAGLGAATAERFDAAYTNPALLSRLRRRELALGFTGASLHLEHDGPTGSIPARGISIGVGLPIPLGGRMHDRIGIGIAFYTPPDAIVRARILYPEKPTYPLLADRMQSLAVRAGIGVDLGYGVRLGAGFAMLSELIGVARVATDATGRVGSQIEDQLVAVYAPTAGVAYEHALGRKRDGAKKIRVGLTARGTLDARFAVDIDAQKLSSLNIPIFNIAGLAQYDPGQFVLEGAYETEDGFIAAGLTYKAWGGYPGVLEPTIPCAKDNPDCSALRPASIDFSSTLVPRVGGEWRKSLGPGARLRVRAGYAFEPTPVPSSLPASRRAEGGDAVEIPTRFFDASRHLFSVGAGVSLAKDLVRLDWYTQLHLLHGRDLTLAPTGERAHVGGAMWVTGFFAGVTF